MKKRRKSRARECESNILPKALPNGRTFSPDAYAQMDDEAQADLLFEYLEDLDVRLGWVDDEMARLGFCAACVMANGMAFPHECWGERGE
jgi:hypothetical protein